MAKTNISFSIENSDTSKMMKTQGIFRNNTLTFFDDEHVKHTMIIDGERIRYKKEGSVDMDFVFEKDRIHRGTYKIKYGTFEFEIHTHELTIEPSHIEAIYTLKQNNEFVNKGHLNVEYETI